MRRWSRIVLVLLVIAAVSVTVVYWFGFPQVKGFSPEANNDNVTANASIRLTFSRPMQLASVEERLSIQPAVDTEAHWESNTLIIEPKQPWTAGVTVQVHLAAGARTAGILPLSVNEETTWSFTVRQPRLLYLYPASGAANIYWLNLKTMEKEPLTEFPTGIQDFSVDQSTSTIYFSANNLHGGSDIYRLDMDAEPHKEAGSTGEHVTPTLVLECAENHCRLPAVSPDRKFLAFERTEKLGFPQVWLLSLNAPKTDQPPLVFLAGDPEHQTLLPSWSSAGRLSFYDTQAAAFVFYNPYTGETIFFPNQTGETGNWHPDGTAFLAPEIFFLNTGVVAGLPSLANSHLILFNLSSKETQDLTPAEDMEDTTPVFSPDGVYLAFARKYLSLQRWTPGRQLWVMMPATGQTQPVTNDPDYTHYEFVWSPDSKQLAYVRFDQTVIKTPPEIWLLELVNAKRIRLVEDGYMPQWLP